MTRVSGWRIVKRRHARHAFTGEGARRAGGRWNSPGVPVVYTSDSAALATLEILVHLEDPRLLESYVLIEARFGHDLVEALDDASLPDDWNQSPAPVRVQETGDAWAEDARSVVLRVPSTVVKGFNYLLNPEHPRFDEVDIMDPQPLDPDPRLIQRRGT